MSSILSLSYNNLSPNLKTCLLYLSAFPEDYKIDRDRLVRRWIAEGFISGERGQSRRATFMSSSTKAWSKQWVLHMTVRFVPVGSMT